MRRTWHCGYLDREEWLPSELPKVIGDVTYDCDVCPGWLVRQPAIAEAAEAGSAYDKGQIGVVFPDAPNLLIEAAILASRSFASHQLYRIRTRREGDSHD